MMPIDAHRLYQLERLRSRAEIQRANEQISRLASGSSELFRPLGRHVAAPIRRFASGRKGAQSRQPAPATTAGCSRRTEPADATDNGFAVVGAGLRGTGGQI